MSNLRDQMAHVTNRHDPQTPPASEDRPLLRSFPNPSRYGVHQMNDSKPPAQPITTRLQQHLTAEISTRWADLQLIVSFFISGMIDAGAYNAYECFCSMQTGNTIFAALGVSDLPVSSPKYDWTKSVASIVSFLVGSSLVAFYHRTFGQRKRWVLAVSFLCQTAIILIAAFLVERGHSSGSPGSDLMTTNLPADPGFPWADLIPIALLAFQASAKVIASRVLESGGLPCVVLTSLYADLVSDPNFFSAGLFGNSQRNRRAGGATFYFVGAVMGGVAASHSIGFAGALFIAALLQLVSACVWLVWSKEESDDDEEGVANGSFG